MIIEKGILTNMIKELEDVGVIHEYQFKELISNATLEEVEKILENESGLKLMAITHELYCSNTGSKQWINMIQNRDIYHNIEEAKDYVQELLKK